jgi:hypothetical protein
MKHADALLEEERYEEALAEYLWCWDHGLEAGPSYSGVRSSFLLMYFNRLERVHPPTRAALVERRDALQARLVPGSDWRSALDDFLTLDEHLKESKAIAHFDALLANAEAAEIRRALVEAVAPELVEQRRYADVVSHVPKLDTWIAEQAQKLNLAESQPEGQEAQVVAYLKRSILGPALTYYEALAGTPEAPGSPGSSAAAGQPSLSEFERAILRIDDSSRTWADLIEAAVRAEAFDRGRALRDEALGHFTERSDVRRIERAAKKLPEPAAAPETPTRD